MLAYDHSDLPPLAFQSGQYALTARKPREELRLGATPPPECNYTEDLLGYLLGRAHYQMLHALGQLLNTQALDERSFFILSVLSIRDRLSLEELNAFIAYTGMVAKAVEEDMADKLGAGDAMALKLLLKRLIASSDPGMPDLWSAR